MISYTEIGLYLLPLIFFIIIKPKPQNMLLILIISIFVLMAIVGLENIIEYVKEKINIKNARKGNFKNISCADISLSKIPESSKYAWCYRDIPSKGVVYSAGEEDISKYSSSDLLEKYFGLYGSGIKVLAGLKVKDRRYWYIGKSDLPKLKKYVQDEYSSFHNSKLIPTQNELIK